MFPDLPVGKPHSLAGNFQGLRNGHVEIMLRHWCKKITMRKATKTVAAWFGITAGIAGIEHGYFEIQQGTTLPGSLMIASIGPPCIPEETWNACEPALTIVPNYLITGILAVILGSIILFWSIFFLQNKYGGAFLILLSIALLLFGGGIFPPLIGIFGGIAGIKINKPISQKQPGRILGFAARLWPWPLVLFLVWIFLQFPIGHFFNDFMQRAMVFGLLLIIFTLPLSVYTAYAHDRCTEVVNEKSKV